MTRRSRLDLCDALRTGLMLVLALCLALQPVLGALGEMHETNDHVASAAFHLDHLTPHDAQHVGDIERDDTDGALHLLLHCAQCCGHTVGLTAAEFEGPITLLSSTQPLPPASPQVVASHLAAAFRPPIQA
jgi:hypothetical protein